MEQAFVYLDLQNQVKLNVFRLRARQNNFYTVRTITMKTNYKAHILLAIFLLLLSMPAVAFLYKFVDQDGRMQMVGWLPPEIAARGDYTRLSNSGRFIEKVPLAKTPEQIAKEKETQRLLKIKDTIIAEEKAQDDILIKTYDSVNQVSLARDRQLGSVDSQIEQARGRIKRHKVRLEDLQKEAAQAERAGRAITTNLLQDIDGTRSQLKKGYEFIILEEKKKEKIRVRFNKDMKRYVLLTELGNVDEPEVVINEGEISSLLETVYECKNELDCNAAWIRAEEYTRQHATTHMQMLGSRIIMTARPIRNEDISITISRIKPDQNSDKNQPIQLFLDLQCKKSAEGQNLCESNITKKIKQEFKAYVADNEKEKEKLLEEKNSS